MAETIQLQFFARCPACDVHTGVVPKETRNIVITDVVTVIGFLVPCQNCGTLLELKCKWSVDVKERKTDP